MCGAPHQCLILLASQSRMRRIQLIELHEQPWFPKFLREEITDTLQSAMNFFGAYAPGCPAAASRARCNAQPRNH